nr:hairy/enhancer-of-split related with YRPW motif protein 2 [Nothobranchius furzeri]
MKRQCEDSLEELYSGRTKASLIRSPTPTAPATTRRKRRGIIEKRRRDRINSSLSELRRLIPTALEKQGSAKLEKAEILQMTVDHLKMLQATGGKGPLDVQVLALDFQSLGFGECVTEVSRYLSSMEAQDYSDPLYSRLLSHLTSCASWHETASHQQPHPFHTHHWAALYPLPYGLVVPLDCGRQGGAPQRLVELMQHNGTFSSPLLPLSLSSLSHSSPQRLPSPALIASFSQPIPSSSKAFLPWGSEVGAF